MKKFITLILSLLFLSLVLSSCVEEIDLPNTREGGQIMIHGLFTPSSGPHVVRVAVTSSKERITEPVSGARVVIFDEDGNSEAYYEREEGRYELEGRFVKGERGKSYYLEVALGNRLFRSLPERMPTVVGHDSLSWNTTPQKFIEVYADSYFPQTDEPLFIRWNVEQVYRFDPTDFPDPFNDIPPPCYVWEYPNRQRVSLYDGELSPTDYLPRTLVTRQFVNYRFLARHYFLVSQLSISREAFEYWEKVNQAVNRTGSIFDAPAAPVPGNFYNVYQPEQQVLGYFEVALTDTASVFTVPGFFNFWIPPYCAFVPFQSSGRYPEACLNCLTLPNSSLRKPDFFQ